MNGEYAAQDEWINASLQRGEGRPEVTTCPRCGDSWTAPVPAEACDCDE